MLLSPAQSAVRCRIKLLIGGHSSDGGGAAAGELVAVAQGRREVRRQRRLSVGTSVAGVEAEKRFRRFFGPSRPVRRGEESKTPGQELGPRGRERRGSSVRPDR